MGHKSRPGPPANTSLQRTPSAAPPSPLSSKPLGASAKAVANPLPVEEKKQTRIPWATLGLCLVCVSLSTASLLGPSRLDATWRALHSSAAFVSRDFWLWVLPATFLHSGWQHLVMNVGVFLLLGAAVERRIGSAWLLSFVLVAAIIPTGLELLGSGAAKVGISGINYALFGMLLLRPPSVRRIAWSVFAVFFLAGLAFGVLFPGLSSSPWGNIAHLTGLALGLGIGLFCKMRLSSGVV